MACCWCNAGCTVTNCQMAVNACAGVEVDIRNNDLSFNEVALVVDGHGVIQDNIMWGNLHRSTVDVSAEALERLQVRTKALHCSAPYMVRASECASLLRFVRLLLQLRKDAIWKYF